MAKNEKKEARKIRLGEFFPGLTPKPNQVLAACKSKRLIIHRPHHGKNAIKVIILMLQ